MRRQRAFTLVEILIVIFLIGVLVIFSVLNVPTQLARARDAERKEHIDKMGKFIEDYYDDTGCYPVSVPTCGNVFSLDEKVYIFSLPCDPHSKLSYVYVSEISDCPSWYQLYGNLEYTSDSIIDVLGCRNGCGPECQFNYGISSSNIRLNPFCEYDQSPAPVPTTSPGPNNLQFVCAPGGSCEAFAAPELSGCPDIYLNDPTCQDQCGTPKNRCHDSKGKSIPEPK